MMADAMDADILVMGGGFAGLAAATRATELGLRPWVLEKGRDEDYPCNSRFSGGFVHIAWHDPTEAPDVLADVVQASTGGFADRKQCATFTGDGQKIIDWLRGKETRFIRMGSRPAGHWVMSPPRTVQSGLSWKGRGPDNLIRRLSAWITTHGGKIVLDTRVDDLLMQDGQCTGVIATQAGLAKNYTALAVVLADGGFQSNFDLLRKYITSNPQGLLQRNLRTGTGDGLKMAEKVGAKLVGLNCFYGHLLSRDAFTNDLLWPHPQLDSLAVSGIVVDSNGRRLADEGLGGTYIANILARQVDPTDAFAVFDSETWDGPGADLSNPPAPNPTLREVGGTIYSARTIDELALKAGIAGPALVQTVSQYNDAVHRNKIGDLDPPRSADGGQHIAIKKPLVIAVPPFFAVPLCSGITYTMGGVAIDSDARVINSFGNPIPNLFAVGSTTGGVEGGPSVGYFGGIAKAVITGLRAAECIARGTARQ